MPMKRDSKQTKTEIGPETETETARQRNMATSYHSNVESILFYLCIRQNGSCCQLRFGYAGGLLSEGKPKNLANHNIGK